MDDKGRWWVKLKSAFKTTVSHVYRMFRIQVVNLSSKVNRKQVEELMLNTLSFVFTASIHALRGSEINILDESTNQNMCVRYSYKLGEQQNPKRKRVRSYHIYSLNCCCNRDKQTQMFQIRNPTICFSLLVEISLGWSCGRASAHIYCDSF